MIATEFDLYCFVLLNRLHNCVFVVSSHQIVIGPCCQLDIQIILITYTASNKELFYEKWQPFRIQLDHSCLSGGSSMEWVAKVTDEDRSNMWPINM